MSLVDAANRFARVPGTERSRVEVSARRESVATVVRIGGEIDATNADSIRQYVAGFMSDGLPLVVDTTRVEFCGAQGIAMLFDVDEECRRAAVVWALVAGDWVSYLLHAADRDDLLPAAESVKSALHRMAERDHVNWFDRFLLDY